MPQNQRRQNQRKKGKGANLGGQSPLDIAVAGRDRDVMALVRTALDHHQAMLAFQPVVDARRLKRVAFYEGLIRVRDATGRIIPARDFMGSIEDNEIGRRIDCLALELGLRELALEPALRLSINMSARSVGYRPWLAALDEGLARDATIGERLILEITEASAIATPEIVITFMRELQRRGVSFALDDFGAGFTSFRYLRDFFFDIVKIDGQFIDGIHANPDNQVLVSALVAISHHFEMFTVAEFVQRKEDVRFLQSIGINCLQGYLFGAPSVSPVWRPREARETA